MGEAEPRGGAGMSHLVRYDAMCRAIAECHEVDEIKGIRNKAVALEAYSKQAQNLDMEKMAAEIRIRAERRTGELLKETVVAGNPGFSNCSPGVQLEDVGISRKQSSRWQKLADIPEPEFEERLRETVKPPTTAGILRPTVRGTQGTGDNEWFTPAPILERSRAFLGEFDLDPASHAQAQESVKASRFFTIEDDGLAQEWHGRVWLNPPYAQPAIAQFCAKLIEEFQAGRVAEALLLTHNYTDTAWWQGVAAVASCFCFTSGRIRFVSPSGSLAAPTQGQVVSYLGDRAGEFREHFESLGIVVFK